MLLSDIKNKIHPELYGVLSKELWEELRPCQEKSIKKGLLDGKNLIVASPTASGKTLVAEIGAVNSILKDSGKAVYLVPLKSLAYEKYKDFKKKYEKLGIRVALAIGDLDSKDPWLANFDLIIATAEKFDSLIRHDVKWISQIRTAVFDEVHLLNDPGRGPTLEILITLLKIILPQLQIIALSATIGNPRELATWLNAELVSDSWRPVKLYHGVLFNDEIDYFGEKGNEILRESISDPGLKLTATLLKKGKQALVFCPTKRIAESTAVKVSALLKTKPLTLEPQKVLKALSRPTRQCQKLASVLEKGIAFHHAGLVNKQKSLIEDLFREGKIKVICSTPTLAFGLNLPADVALMKSLKRFSGKFGSVWIPVLEYHQMCLPYNEKLILESGEEVEIGRFVEKRRGDKVLSFNVEEQKLEFKPAISFYRKKDKLIQLKMDCGTQITLTKNHPLLIKQSDKLIWKEVNKLKVGDRILYQIHQDFKSKKLPYFFELLPETSFVLNVGHLITEAKKKLSITEKELAKKLNINYKISYHYKNNIKAMPLRVVLKLCNLLRLDEEEKAKLIQKVKSAYGKLVLIPKKIDEKFLWLVGLIATDGNLNHCREKRTRSEYTKIRIFNTNTEIINEAKRILKSFGLKPYESLVENCISLEVGSTLLAKIINKYFGVPYGNKTTSVNIPKFLLSSNKELIGEYLAGVFDGDGSYTEIPNKKFSNTKKRRILFVTASKEFAINLHKLLLRIGILSKITEDKREIKNLLKGKEIIFRKPVYYIYFYKIKYLSKFQKYVKPIKARISVSYIKYHNLNKYYSLKEDLEWVRVKDKKLLQGNHPVYNLGIKDNENYFASNILIHNCGRAGRPGKSLEGLAVSLAKTEQEKKRIHKKFIQGAPEDIVSKLSVIPTLRTSLLGLIASGFITNKKELVEFFNSSFYGFQYGNDWTFEEKLSDILDTLKIYGFVKVEEERIRPTLLGKRISELYIDPETAFKIIQSIKKEQTVLDFSFLQVISNSIEMEPLLNMRKDDYEFIEENLARYEPHLLQRVPREWEVEYEQFMRSFKTALLLNYWVEEKSEEHILEKFGVRPGGLYVKIRNSEWLLYATSEIARILKLKSRQSELNKTRIRVKHGIKEELIPLIKLRGIGRFRARQLHKAGLKNLGYLRKAHVNEIARVLKSEKIAKNVKEQLGQESKNNSLYSGAFPHAKANQEK